MKRYEKYKSSGIEWIGEVPEHWELMPFKFRMDINNGMDYKHIQVEEGYPVMGSGGQFACASKYMYDGEVVLLGRKGTVDKPLYFNGKFWAVDTMFYAIPIGETCCKYMYYQATTFPFSYYQTATALPSMTQTDLGNNRVCVPPLDEQEAIAAYLDARCGDIDKVVATQEKRIALLNEMKQSVITQAVTRGLNPDAKMKDSGVEWIGMVPEHWDVMPFKSKFKTDKGLSITKADLVDEGVPVISYGQIHSKQNDYVHTLDHLLRFIPEELIPADSKAKLEIGDIVFADTSEDVEGSGNAFYIEREGVYAGYHTVIAKSIERVDNKYFAYLFATPMWRSQVRSQVYGVKVYSITQQILKATSLIVPSPEEQKQIVEVLEEKCARIDRQIDNIQNEIELLREYKQSLITDVVTGKVKVC